MTITLELKPEVEKCAAEQAASSGVPVKDFLESVIKDGLNGGEGQLSYQTVKEWEAALDALADSPAFAKAASRFVDDSREGIYQGEG